MDIKLIIDPKLKEWIPSLNSNEYQTLEEKIINEGCRDAIIIWHNKEKMPEKKYCQHCCEDVSVKLSNYSYQCVECETILDIAYTIIDGHNRYEICQRHGIEFETKILEFENVEQVEDWIDENQLGRRNLTDDQRRLIIGRRYNREKKQGVRTDLTSGQNVQKLTTAKKIAEENKINEKTVRRCGQLFTKFEKMKVDQPELATKIFKGDKTFKEIKHEEKSKQLEKKKEIYIEEAKAVMIGAPEVSLMNANDFLNTFEDDSIDLLFTDPPYSTDIPNIAEFTEKWLTLAVQKTKKSGRMLVFSGSYPIEIQAFLNVLLKQKKFIVDNPLIWTYKNTLAKTPEMHYNLNYQMIWHLFSDVSSKLDTKITSEMFSVQEDNAPDGRQGNRLHTWQKSDELSKRLIRHTTKPENLVVDPFTCTGTFIIAANTLGRVGKGCDIDQKNLNIAINRGCKLININGKAPAILDTDAQTIGESEVKSTLYEDILIQDASIENLNSTVDGLLELDGDIVKVDNDSDTNTNKSDSCCAGIPPYERSGYLRSRKRKSYRGLPIKKVSSN